MASLAKTLYGHGPPTAGTLAIVGGDPQDVQILLDAPRRVTALSAWQEHIPFAMFLVGMIRPDTIVELGTHAGDSYCTFCQAVSALQLATRCFAIDTWKGDPQTGVYGPEVLEDLRRHHDSLYGSFSTLVQSTFDQALSYFSEGSITLLHIDGLHTYEAVKHDFELWLPKMSSRGVVLFHDTAVRERDFGVWRLWEEVKCLYPHFEFMHGHGLGILAVGREQSKRALEFFNGSEEQIAAVRRFFFALGDKVAEMVRLSNSLDSERHLRRELEASLARQSQMLSEVGQIQKSRGWKALQHYYVLRNRVLPEGSRRRNACKRIWRATIGQRASSPTQLPLGGANTELLQAGLDLEAGAKPRVLVVCPDFVGRQRLGLAVRHWEIARALTSRGYHVTLVTPRASDLDGESPFAFFPSADAGLVEQLLRSHEVVLCQGSVTEEFPFLVKKAKKLIVDLVCPMHLEDLEKGDAVFERAVKLVGKWLKYGDFYICGNERQRDYWLGMLSHAGRILGPYRKGDRTLRDFIDVVPFGIPDDKPRKEKNVIRGVIPGIEHDAILFLWWGGIWDWLDPDIPITAAVAAHKENPAIRLVFSNRLRPNGELTVAAGRAFALAQKMGALNSVVFFNDAPIPYDQRGNYLLEADVGIISQRRNLETRFAARTRALDYWWAGLPILCGEGDEVSDFVRREEIGMVVGGDVDSWIQGFLRCAEPVFRNTLGMKIAPITDSLKWNHAVQPIERFCNSLVHCR